MGFMCWVLGVYHFLKENYFDRAEKTIKKGCKISWGIRTYSLDVPDFSEMQDVLNLKFLHPLRQH